MQILQNIVYMKILPEHNWIFSIPSLPHKASGYAATWMNNWQTGLKPNMMIIYGSMQQKSYTGSKLSIETYMEENEFSGCWHLSNP
jgi:hypothetical protein